MARERLDLTLGQQAFLRELQALAERKRELVQDARVAVKRNAGGDLVFAIISADGAARRAVRRVPFE